MGAKLEHETRLRAFDDFLAAYESEHGVITDEEIREVTRRMRAQAAVGAPHRG